MQGIWELYVHSFSVNLKLLKIKRLFAKRDKTNTVNKQKTVSKCETRVYSNILRVNSFYGKISLLI